MTSELFDTPNPSSRLSEEVLPKAERIVHNDFELPFLPDEHKEIKRQIVLLGRKNNKIQPMNKSLD